MSKYVHEYSMFIMRYNSDHEARAEQERAGQDDEEAQLELMNVQC